jgi:hypothetical protein
MTTIHESRPFNLRYIVRAPSGIHGDERRATHRTALCNYLYIIRENGADEFGPTPDFAARRNDLVATGRAGPHRSHRPSHAGRAIWAAADDASRAPRPELATAMHAVGSLPPELDSERWEQLIATFCDDELAARGMVVDWAIHALRGEDGGYTIAPHVHWLITSRTFDGPKPGQWQKAWISSSAQDTALRNAWYRLTGMYPLGYKAAA